MFQKLPPAAALNIIARLFQSNRPEEIIEEIRGIVEATGRNATYTEPNEA